MQIYAINASPRKDWNTATILKKALDGATEANSNIRTEMINLYGYNYTGCRSCFACKLLGGTYYGKCATKDGIHEILQNVLQADAIIFGSPIYFGDITGMMRSFLERLIFPCFVYDANFSSIAPRKIKTAFVYTMNVNIETMNNWHYPERLGFMENFIGRAFGYKPQVLYVNDTVQFSDYKKYKCEVFSETDKLRHKKEQFPIDCQNAMKIGASLVSDNNE